MTATRYDEVIYEVLFASNQLIMRYVRSSDANYLLKAIELQADALRILETMLRIIERNDPCPN